MSDTQTFYQNPIMAKIKEFSFIILIISIMIIVVTMGHLVPLEVQRWAYTASSLIRGGLMFLLPFLVFPFVVMSITHLKSNGLTLIVSLLVLITLSNFLSILVGSGAAAFFVPWMNFSMTFDPGDAEPLLAFFDFNLEPLVSVEALLLLGVAVGFSLTFKTETLVTQKITTFFEGYKTKSIFFFQNIFIPLLPLYIFGMLLKLNAENDFSTVFSDFGSLIMVIIVIQIIYVFLVFLLGAGLSLQKARQCFLNALPAGLLGFSTMSSLVTMPVTLRVAEKNLGDKDLSQIAITSTVNCHDVGECISLSLITMAVYLMANGMMMPDIIVFIKFAAIFAVAQFSGVSVPGGSVVILIPLLGTYLNFTPEMIGLVTTIAIFMDPVGTGQNVMGNSGFALVIQRYFKGIQWLLKKELRSI